MVITERKGTDALGCENIRSLFFKLAVPAVSAQILSLSYNLVDRIYIGHLQENGDLALAGVGICLPLIIIISAFALLFSIGAAPRASFYLGKGDRESAEKVLGNSISLIALISAFLTAVILIFMKDILLRLGASPNTIGYASDYMSIYSLGTILILITLGLNAFISMQGFYKISIYTVLIGVVSNIILDPIIIFVFEMGVKGAAIATVISQCISTIWTLCFLLGDKSTIKIKLSNFKLESHICFPCITQGLAPFLLQLTESVAVLCFYTSLMKNGGDLAVGTMTILFSIMQFLMIPLFGFAQGAQPIISYNYGAKNLTRVKKTVKLLLISCLIFSMTLWAAVELWPQIFIRIFTGDEELAKFAAPALRIYFMASGILGIQIACQQTFFALGKVKKSAHIAVFKKLILLIPLIYILPSIPMPVTKITAVFMAEPLADAIAVLFTTISFSVFFRKTLIEAEAGAKDEHKQSAYFLLLRKTIRFWTKPMKTVWDVPFEGKPSIFVCNHDRAFGPIAMCAHFELCEDVRPWINAQVLSEKEAPSYIRQDYWWDLNKWYSPILGHTVAYIYALILPPILRGSDCIPVYHDASVISTLRESVKMLSDRKHILLFPEHPTGYCTYGEKIFDGFVSIGRLYYARTKDIVNFYPTYIDWKKKIIRVGKPVAYDPLVKYEEQVIATTAAIEDYFKKHSGN